ncbi:hypothetical protein NFI96_002286 [Prochilodus magdalenae]|nr:hypothetical protein NFI96_002286 [Prochilodus magdalenae]
MNESVWKMIVDFRRGRHAHLPLHVGGSAVEVVSSYRYLGVHLSNNLTWSNNTSSLVRKAHQRLYFLRRLRRAGLGSSVLTSFYRCVVESVLCSSINVWHGSCSAADRKALQRVVKAAQRSVGVSLPTTTDIYTSRCRKRATCIMKDPTHPAHSLFVPLPSGRRLRSIKCRTNRLRNSFIPEAVELLRTVTLLNAKSTMNSVCVFVLYVCLRSLLCVSSPSLRTSSRQRVSPVINSGHVRIETPNTDSFSREGTYCSGPPDSGLEQSREITLVVDYLENSKGKEVWCCL